MQRTDTINDQVNEWQRLEEQATHGTLTPLEAQWLEDYRRHCAAFAPSDVPGFSFLDLERSSQCPACEGTGLVR